MHREDSLLEFLDIMFVWTILVVNNKFGAVLGPSTRSTSKL